MTRLARAWGELEPEQRLAAVAALALLVTMFLPWYELQSLDRRTDAINSRSISAFGDVSFVEAAVFLVAAGVLALMFARAERRDFHMPGSDGAVVMVAGGWVTLLIFYRVFSRPAGHGYPVGIQWGFFLAFIAAGALTYAGWRMRALAAPEPPLLRPRGRGRARHEPVAEDLTVVAPGGQAGGRAGRQAGRRAPVHAQRAAPIAAHSAPEPSGSAVVGPAGRAPASTPPSPPSTGNVGRKRPRYPPAPSDQLSFEDHPPDPERG